MDLFNPYEKLKRILGEVPSHPWGALIPQALLWSFRRFCIQKLIVQEGTLMEHLWEDHLELIHSYSPKGLEMACIDWLIPENIAHVSSSLEGYNLFFIDLLKMIDIVMEDSDYKAQDTISEFLDVGMGEYIERWLGDTFRNFLIFPQKIEDDNEFTSAQFSRLISNLMQFARTQARALPPPEEPLEEPLDVPQEEPPEEPPEAALEEPPEVALEEAPAPEAALEEAPAPEAVLEEAPPPAPPPAPAVDPFMQDNSLLWQMTSLPTLVSQPIYEPYSVTQPLLSEPLPPLVLPQPPSEPVHTVKEAIRRRRITIKKNGRYSRVKTRRSHLNL